MKRMLANVCPELINEWSQRNLPLTPESVTHGSHKIVWWKGKCGHEWRASIKNRVIGGSGCPYCSHNAILEGFNDLASQKPELAAGQKRCVGRFSMLFQVAFVPLPHIPIGFSSSGGRVRHGR